MKKDFFILYNEVSKLVTFLCSSLGITRDLSRLSFSDNQFSFAVL